MGNDRPVKPAQMIKHILVDREAMNRFPERISDILRHFPTVTPVVVASLNRESIQRHFREAFPNAEVQAEKKTSSAVSVGKRFLVIGAVEKEQGAEKFVDTRGLVCRGFYNINAMINGCVFNCQYCFLQEHIWDKEVSAYIRLNVNYEEILERMREIAGRRLREGRATGFHTGIMMDYLGFEEVTRFTEFLLPRLDDPAFARTFIDMWSKGNDTRALLNAAVRYSWATERILPGWSFNSVYAADHFEPGTARTIQRLQAARELQAAGYRITVRIDPIIAHPNWETEYRNLVGMIYDDFGIRPNVFTVGTLRFNEMTLIETGRERFPDSAMYRQHFIKEDKAKYRLPYDENIKILQTVIDEIRRHDPQQPVGVCKENLKTWKALGLNPAATCLSGPCLENTISQFVLD